MIGQHAKAGAAAKGVPNLAAVRKPLHRSRQSAIVYAPGRPKRKSWWVALAIAALLPAGMAVAQSSKPENAFLKSIADAAERNDVEELVSTVHTVVIDSFGKEKCSEALTLTPKPGMVVAGRAVRSTMASWKNAQGRTQIFMEGTPFKGAVTTMERGKMTGMGTFDFVKDSAGKFHLFIDCNRKFITAK